MFFVYALKSINFNFIYVGLTNNLERRIKQHNYKENTSTKFYAPFILLHTEQYNTRIDARKIRLSCCKHGQTTFISRNALIRRQLILQFKNRVERHW